MPTPLPNLLPPLLAALVAGCAARDPGPPATPAAAAVALRTESLRKMDPVRIQVDTMAFADRFVTAMSDAYDELERGAPTPEARDAAHRLKTDMALAAVGNAVNPRPIAGMMDMVAMVTLLRRIADDPWTARTFGPRTDPLTDRLAQLNADVRTLAAKYLTDRQLAEIVEVVDEWRRNHPDERHVSHLHLADLPAANRPPELESRSPGSIFGLMSLDLTAELDPAVRELELVRATSERMFYYLQRLPFLIQWQTEGSLRGALAAPQFVRAADNVDAVAASATRFADASDRFAGIAARFTDTVAGLPAQLSADVARERDAAVRQAAAAFRHEQRNFVGDSEAAIARSLDRLTWRLTGLVLLLLALYAATSLALRSLARPPRVADANRDAPDQASRPARTQSDVPPPLAPRLTRPASHPFRS